LDFKGACQGLGLYFCWSSAGRNLSNRAMNIDTTSYWGLAGVVIFFISIPIFVGLAQKHYWAERIWSSAKQHLPDLARLVYHYSRLSIKTSDAMHDAEKSAEERAIDFGSCLLIVEIFGVVAVVVLTILIWAFGVVF
jgi:hypothetical protein